MRDQPRRVIVRKDYSGHCCFYWEDTDIPLTYDELRDVELIFNDALLQQFVNQLDSKKQS